MTKIGVHRAVGSPALDTGRYQHSACQSTEIVDKGNVLALCGNRSCPNKGANWVLQEMTATVAVKECTTLVKQSDIRAEPLPLARTDARLAP
jgi:lipoate synthase